MGNIPRIKFFTQRRYRANWPFPDRRYPPLKNPVVLPAKHDIRDIFREAENLPVGEYLYISALFSAQIAILYNALANLRINALSNESKIYDTALNDARLARIAQALPGFEMTEAMAGLSNNVTYYRELRVDLCNSLGETLTAMKPLILGGGHRMSRLCQCAQIIGCCGRFDKDGFVV